MVGLTSRFSNKSAAFCPGQSAITRPPLSAPPASSTTVAVPWSVPFVPLMRAVRPNSVTSTTTVSRHAGPHVFLDGGESPVERAQQLRQPASCDAFIIMCVPAVERERADARTVGLCQELCGGANGLGEIGTQLSEVGASNLANRLLLHAAGRSNCRELGAAFNDAREVDISVPIEVQQAQDRI